MTIKELKEIISKLPEGTLLLIEGTEFEVVKTIGVNFHSNGRTHLIFSTLE